MKNFVIKVLNRSAHWRELRRFLRELVLQLQRQCHEKCLGNGILLRHCCIPWHHGIVYSLSLVSFAMDTRFCLVASEVSFQRSFHAIFNTGAVKTCTSLCQNIKHIIMVISIQRKCGFLVEPCRSCSCCREWHLGRRRYCGGM